MHYLKRSKAVCGMMIVLTIACLAVSRVGAEQASNSSPPSAWKEYYPLAVGNSWTYSVHERGKEQPGSVKWEVTAVQSDPKTGGPVYIVIPTPREEPGEDFKALLFAEDGLKDVGVDPEVDTIYLLKFPIRKGRDWTLSSPGSAQVQKPNMHWRVLSVNEPCMAGSHSFADCVVVEEIDEEEIYENVGLRTVVTYARHVGPVKYVYYRVGEEEDLPMSSVELASYCLSQKD